MTIAAASFAIDGLALEAYGQWKITKDTLGTLTVPTIYGLLTFGLVTRVDEIWATNLYNVPITGWSGTTLPSTSWTSTTLPVTVWSP